MKYFVHRTLVDASQERVAAFHRDSRALKRLTPPPVFMQMDCVEPMGEGSRVDFTMWLGPIPVRWKAVHSDVSDSGFTDTQMEGPFAYWAHRHTFRTAGPKVTEIVDEIECVPGRHLFWGLVSRIMWLSLPLLFAYRGWATKRALQAASSEANSYAD